jgi:hypothetical protein
MPSFAVCSRALSLGTRARIVAVVAVALGSFLLIGSGSALAKSGTKSGKATFCAAAKRSPAAQVKTTVRELYAAEETLSPKRVFKFWTRDITQFQPPILGGTGPLKGAAARAWYRKFLAGLKSFTITGVRFRNVAVRGNIASAAVTANLTVVTLLGQTINAVGSDTYMLRRKSRRACWLVSHDSVVVWPSV